MYEYDPVFYRFHAASSVNQYATEVTPTPTNNITLSVGRTITPNPTSGGESAVTPNVTVTIVHRNQTSGTTGKETTLLRNLLGVLSVLLLI